MFGLNKRENRTFRLCMIGHLLLGIGLFFSGLLPSCEKEPEKIHVFELASTSPQTIVQPKPKPVLTPPPPTSPTPPKKEVPKPPAPTPQVKPKVESKPPLKPTPKPVQPKPKPKPPTPSPTKPKPISFEQFRKNHKLPAPPKNQSKPSNLPPVKLNPNDFSLPKIKVTTPQKSNPSVSPNAVNQYLARIKAKLESIWRERLTHASLQTGGEARLSFRISSNGTLIYPKLSKSSGNPQLDRLVLEVAQRGGVFGPPPGGRFDSVLEIPFRVQ